VAASDSGAWVVTETRPIWRVALWVAPPLAAASLALLVIGLLLAMWGKGSAESRLASQRVVVQVAGAIPGWDAAAKEAEIRKSWRMLLWTVPVFLILFPFVVKGIFWGQVYLRSQWPEAPEWVSWAVALSPVAVGAVWLLRQWLPAIGFEIRATIITAVLFFVLPRLPLPESSPLSPLLTLAILAALLLVLFRNQLAKAWTRRPLLAGQYDRALRRLWWLTLGHPTAKILSIEGTIHVAAGRKAEAEQCFRRALALAGNASPEFRCDVLACLGLTLAELGRNEEAQRCLETVIELGYRTGEAKFGLAAILISQSKDPERALGLLEEALRIKDLAWPDRMTMKAQALASLGRHEEMNQSIAAALQAIDRSPALMVAAVHLHVGQVLASVQRIPEALEHFRVASKADPHGIHGQAARRELDRHSASTTQA
jgi:tetratricopeptide (TPR) repeat protein